MTNIKTKIQNNQIMEETTVIEPYHELTSNNQTVVFIQQMKKEIRQLNNIFQKDDNNSKLTAFTFHYPIKNQDKMQMPTHLEIKFEKNIHIKKNQTKTHKYVYSLKNLTDYKSLFKLINSRIITHELLDQTNQIYESLANLLLSNIMYHYIQPNKTKSYKYNYKIKYENLMKNMLIQMNMLNTNYHPITITLFTKQKIKYNKNYDLKQNQKNKDFATNSKNEYKINLDIFKYIILSKPECVQYSGSIYQLMESGTISVDPFLNKDDKQPYIFHSIFETTLNIICLIFILFFTYSIATTMDAFTLFLFYPSVIRGFLSLLIFVIFVIFLKLTKLKDKHPPIILPTYIISIILIPLTILLSVTNLPIMNDINTVEIYDITYSNNKIYTKVKLNDTPLILSTKYNSSQTKNYVNKNLIDYEYEENQKQPLYEITTIDLILYIAVYDLTIDNHVNEDIFNKEDTSKIINNNGGN